MAYFLENTPERGATFYNNNRDKYPFLDKLYRDSIYPAVMDCNYHELKYIYYALKKTPIAEDIYALLKESKLEIVQLSKVYQQAVGQAESFSLQEKEEGKILEYSIRYTDIFGKDVTESGKLHVIDGINDISGKNNRQNQSVRFISKEYFNTLEQDSQWYREEENKKELENILNSEEFSGEIYEIQKR